MNQFLGTLLAFFLFFGCVSTAKTTQNMTVHALRLLPGQDLKRELEAFAKAEHLQAGFIVTGVGLTIKKRE